jgi:MYXO-CTERM domain-containing protein
MSVDGGTNWSTLIATYTPIVNSASPTGAGVWTSTAYNAAYTSSIALGATADNAASILVRVKALVDPVNGSGVYQAGGTARIDNVFVNGTAVPAPGAVALLGVAGLAARRRRR